MIRNRLSRESSPYLLQHQANPVDWWPWTPTALQEAKRLDKPILLSVGYSACHWCHVMAHESFEDPETAQLMNDLFVNIKVDREERPDIDRIYMTSLQALGEPGGWPLTMFLTPDAHPFWGGTYFPPETRYGKPGFKHVLRQISHIWHQERNRVLNNADAIHQALRPHSSHTRHQDLTPAQLTTAANTIATAVDPRLGGLRGAPKFPQAPLFSFLWQAHCHNPGEIAPHPVLNTLHNICQGGIYDHLGGGLSRYSVDASWLVPHFEKMLYDNAQFISQLSRLWLSTRNPLFKARAAETIQFALTSLRTPEGTFAASLDADSEGHEGRYYIWNLAEIESILGADNARLFSQVYGVTAQGNWEGHNIFFRNTLAKYDPEIENQLGSSRQALLQARLRRVQPALDDKILTDWNGLMITALAEAALAFRNHSWRLTAESAYAALKGQVWQENALHHSYRSGRSAHPATADDYANLVTACIRLHAVTANKQYIADAVRLTDQLIEHYSDITSAGFYYSPDSATDLILRTKTPYDDATPNANGVMLSNLIILYYLTGRTSYQSLAAEIAATFSAAALDSPFACPSVLSGLLNLVDPISIVAAHQPSPDLLLAALETTGLDVSVLHVSAADVLPPQHPVSGTITPFAEPSIYICRGHVCAAPVANSKDLRRALTSLRFEPTASGVH